MKKSMLVAGALSVMVTAGLLVYFQPDAAATNSDQERVAISEGTQAIPMQVTNAGCAKIQCGSCPGAKCKVKGICCYVRGTGGARDRDGVAECGCTAQGEPVCKCKVGQPR